MPLALASAAAPVAAAAPGRGAAAKPAAPAELVVKKGDPVELIAGGDVFSVSRLMVADEDGAIGDTIRVHEDGGRGREDGKSLAVSARVEAAGRVRTPTI